VGIDVNRGVTSGTTVPGRGVGGGGLMPSMEMISGGKSEPEGEYAFSK
jgi:hypothetical protein